MRNRVALPAALLFLIGAVSATFGSAADYPVKPIELLCPYTAGASIDIMARLIADIAPTYMGQPIAVVNKPGAGGSLAAAEVISAKPDGYKLVALGQGFFALTTKTQKIPFDPDELVPIANFMAWRLALMVRTDAPWKSLKDLLDYGKKNVGQLNWAHSGRGTPPHIIALDIFKKAGVQATDVPYKGSPEALSALLGGHIQAASLPYGTVKDQVRAGKVRPLAFYSEKRYSDLPNVPCIVELGFPVAAILMTYVALYAHKNTPEAIKTYLTGVSKKIYDDPRFKKLPEIGGEDPQFGGPEFVRQTIRNAEEVGIPILKEIGLYVGK
ncbi:MAG: tripartite tricarboxylate transporter substrate binding protein [Syntrophales bacterium LBB04]|nr:tripartite tricarboxylate transporter substrate binding protein [Syntrophales bacterium LBB04]